MTHRIAAFIHSPEIEKYHYPPDSPFKTERAGLTRSILASMDLLTGPDRIETAPVAASENELLLYHTPVYIEAIKRVSTTTELFASDLFMGLGIGDCPVFPDLHKYAVLASGATITGAKLILENRAAIAFNPSGGYHHAYAAKAGGFCYINDIVLGCKVLANAGKRVFCLDLDVHQGNGTQDAFYASPQVMTVSLHESGKTLFPWIGFENELGEGEGRGYNVNLPFPPGTDDDIYVAAFREIVPPLIAAYKPDVIVCELGMDVLSVDPLAHLKLTNNAFADIIPLLLQFDTPMLVTGGGGYNPQATARGWALAWSVLCGEEPLNDMAIGMGGVFLGSSEWSAGLRDMRAYAQGEEKKTITETVQKTVAYIKKEVFPIHKI